MQTTNDTTVKASRTITPIEGTDGRFEWYTYNEDLRIIHSVEDDMFHAGSIIKALGSTKRVNDWLSNKQTVELLSGFTMLREFPQHRIVKEVPKEGAVKITQGTYIHRLLINHFAMWISPKYAYKISVILDDHFELQRKVEENRALEDKNKTLIQKVDELLSNNRKILADNRELKQSMKSVQSTMTKMEITLNSLVESVSEIRNHVTSNKICRYIIVLWVIESESNNDTTIIRPFCGLRENLPKVDGRKVFECEVPCSIDTFKETLERLKNDYYYKTYYRSIALKTRYLDEFIEAFSYTFKRINRTVYDISAHLDDIKDTIASTGTELSKRMDETQQTLEYIEDRIAKFDRFISSYGADQSLVERLLDGELKCSKRGKVYTIQLSAECQRPFIIQNDKHTYIPISAFRQMFL